MVRMEQVLPEVRGPMRSVVDCGGGVGSDNVDRRMISWDMGTSKKSS